MFANRFACGSSVAKNNQGQDEIVVQGDFSDELLKMILSNWTNVILEYNRGKIVCIYADFIYLFLNRFLRRILTRLKKRRRRSLNSKYKFMHPF